MKILQYSILVIAGATALTAIIVFLSLLLAYNIVKLSIELFHPLSYYKEYGKQKKEMVDNRMDSTSRSRDTRLAGTAIPLRDGSR